MFNCVWSSLVEEFPALTFELLSEKSSPETSLTAFPNWDVVVYPDGLGDHSSFLLTQLTATRGGFGSADIGDQYALFETSLDAMPHLANQNRVNPLGLIQAGVMMLLHMGQTDVALRIHHACLKTLQDGIHTEDRYGHIDHQQPVGTMEFAQAVVDRLGPYSTIFRPILNT